MYLPFYFICDGKGWRIPLLTILGMNWLLFYLVQQALGDMHRSRVVPQDVGVLVLRVANDNDWIRASEALVRAYHEFSQTSCLGE
jgi:hypothetical protein